MSTNCFFMLCTNRTKNVCLQKGLFGDKVLNRYNGVSKGDLGFLLNVSNDTLMGIFQAEGAAQQNIDTNAWDGEFPAQIKVKRIGVLQTIRRATPHLNNIVNLISVRRGAYKVPYPRVYGQEITKRVLSLFKYIPKEIDLTQTLLSCSTNSEQLSRV